MDNKPLLKIRGLSKSFGGIKAQSEMEITLEQNSIGGIIGPNGAGKTTLFNLITGMYSPDSGTIQFKSRNIETLAPHLRVKLGITRTFQNVELFGSLTVLENVQVGQYVRTKSGMVSAMLKTPGMKREEKRSRDEAMDLLSFVGLSHVSEHRADQLPLGWQRLLEIARAMASSPSLILLDEPAAGLNTVETSDLGKLILKIKDRGIGVLLVEHDMDLTMGICDYIFVLDQGRKIAQGSPGDIQKDPKVIGAYLGQ